MKKLLSSMVALLLCTATAMAVNQVIEQDALPKSAQSFIAKNYPTQKVAIATMDKGFFSKEYNVTLSDDVKIEFDSNGEWSDIECKRQSEVPMSILPTKVASYIKDRFPKNKIVKAERDNKSIDIELNNDIELKFNNKGDIIEIDN